MKLTHLLTAIALSCTLSMAMPAMADTQADFDTALSYYDNQDYTQAFNIFQRLAEQGDVESQFRLGVMYRNGRGITQDYAQATKWYTKAALQGDATSAYIIGALYYDGEGVQQNLSTAKEWFSKACDLGDQDGCNIYKQLNEQGY